MPLAPIAPKQGGTALDKIGQALGIIQAYETIGGNQDKRSMEQKQFGNQQQAFQQSQEDRDKTLGLQKEKADPSSGISTTSNAELVKLRVPGVKPGMSYTQMHQLLGQEPGQFIEKAYGNQLSMQKDAYQKGLDQSKQAKLASVPGFDKSQDATPTEDDAKKLKDLNSAYISSNSSINKLKDMVSKSGLPILPSPTKDQMARLKTDLTLKIKDIAALGQISASDQQLLLDMIPDPTNPLQRPSTVISNLEQLDEILKGKVQARAQASGYVEKQSGAIAGQQQNPLIPRQSTQAKPQDLNNLNDDQLYQLWKNRGK